MNENMIEADSFDFYDRITSGPVFVFFYHYLDRLSRMMEQLVDEIVDEYADQVCFIAVDVEQSPDLAAEYEIGSVPAVLLLLDGQPEQLIEGINPQDVYTGALDDLL